MAEERPTEPALPDRAQLTVGELRRCLETRAVGRPAREQRTELPRAVGPGELLVDPFACLAVGFDLDPLEVQPLLRAELPPDGPLESIGHQVVGRDPYGLLDDPADRCDLARAPGTPQLALDVDISDRAVARQDAQGSRVGGELVVGVAEVRVLLRVEREHRLQLALDLGSNLRVQVDQFPTAVALTLPQDEEHRPLDVVAGADPARGLGQHRPGGSDLEARCPQHEGEVDPHLRILVDEQDHLVAVVRHAARQVPVALRERQAERLPLALHRERSLALGVPAGEELGKPLLVPGQEELGEFVVVTLSPYPGSVIQRSASQSTARASIGSTFQLPCTVDALMFIQNVVDNDDSARVP